MCMVPSRQWTVGGRCLGHSYTVAAYVCVNNVAPGEGEPRPRHTASTSLPMASPAWARFSAPNSPSTQHQLPWQPLCGWGSRVGATGSALGDYTWLISNPQLGCLVGMRRTHGLLREGFHPVTLVFQSLCLEGFCYSQL